jgi:hypothetical protein
MAVIEIRTNGGDVIDTITVEEIASVLDNGRVWHFNQRPLGELVVRRAEVALGIEMSHPQGSRTEFVEEGEDCLLHTERDRGRLAA